MECHRQTGNGACGENAHVQAFRLVLKVVDLSRTGTHVDFLIYKAIGKTPVVAIEVDGFHYHKKGSRQHERDIMKDSIFSKYDLPLLRFKTNGSGEAEQINCFLKGYVSH